MEIHPIAIFHSPLTSKFGIPRQSGLCPTLAGQVVFTPAYRHEEAVRGLSDFSHLWLIWQFSANHIADSTPDSTPDSSPDLSPLTTNHSPQRPHRSSLTVRPPRLGGNRRVGVFASRSPFRPNGLGLSCVRLDRVEMHPELGPVLHVLGADLMDGTPIFDVKPYVPYADSHPDAAGGFTDTTSWQPLEVELPEALAAVFTPEERQALCDCLSQDPRPQYHADASRIYGMPFAGRDVRFRVDGGRCVVEDVVML